MKRLITVAVTILIGLGVWFVGKGQADRVTPTAVKQESRNDRVEITPWGTLKSLKNKNGKEIFGKDISANEGYSLSYQLLDSKTGKSAGEEHTIYAIGNGFSGNEQDCEICKKNRLAAITKTKDGVLRITSNFYLNPQSGLLKVSRYIENLSKNPVRIVAVRLQYDQRLASDKPGLFGIIDMKKTKIRNEVGFSQSPNSISNTLISGFLPATTVEPDIYCVYCPPNCEPKYLTVSPGRTMYICAKCDGNNVIQVDSYVGNIFTSANCTTSIKIEGWDGDSKGANTPPRRQLICLTCENSKVVPKTLADTSDSYIKSLQDAKPSQCQLPIRIDRGPQPVSPVANMKIPPGGTAEASTILNVNSFQ